MKIQNEMIIVQVNIINITTLFETYNNKTGQIKRDSRAADEKSARSFQCNYKI